MNNFEHTPPSSVDAEIGTIGSVLINSDCYYELAEVVKASDYFIARHMWIWEVIEALINRGVPLDNITVVEELKTRGQLDDIGGPAYITHLINNTPTHIHAIYYAHIVAVAATRRRLLNAAGDIAQIALEENSPIDEICNLAEASVMSATERVQVKREASMRDAASRYFDTIETRFQNKDKIPGIPTGFTALDSLIAGFQKSEFTIVASRPGHGKTAWMMSCALNIALQGGRVGIFSLEMSEEQLMGRFVSMITGIDSDKLRRGNLDEQEYSLFCEAIARLGKLHIYFDTATDLTNTRLRTKTRRWYREHGIEIVFVDYLQLMLSDSNEENAVQELSNITRTAKVISLEFNIPVIGASQLNRKLEDRSDKRPQLADLRGSGSLEQDADNVIFLYNDSKYNPKTLDKDLIEANVAKQRNGPTGMVKLGFIGENTRFVNPQQLQRRF